MSTTIISKNMPTMSGGTTDRDSSFILGRRAFLNQTFKTHQSANLGKNIDYSNVKNLKTSNIYAKPSTLNNNSSELRTQRLRLNAIGGGSTKLKNSSDQISFVKNGADKNFVNNALSKVRGGGSVAPKKGK